MLARVRAHRRLVAAVSFALASLVAPLVAPHEARADSPPMPPCPPGWDQSGPDRCTKPFDCPPGWKLDAGPKCVPFQCKEDRDCAWKGNVPCVAADLCFEPGGDRALRVCEASASGSLCPSGLSCRAAKLCGSPGWSKRSGGEKFGNWPPVVAPLTSATGTSPSAAPSITASGAASGAVSGAASAQASDANPKDAPVAAPRKGGCGSCGVTRGSDDVGASAALVLCVASVLARRRARRRR
jgi:hypothetical protein